LEVLHHGTFIRAWQGSSSLCLAEWMFAPTNLSTKPLGGLMRDPVETYMNLVRCGRADNRGERAYDIFRGC